MEQLSGLDAAFVHQDSPRTPMHVTAVLIYDGSGSGGAIRLQSLQRLVKGRLWCFPVFRRRLRRIAMDMDTPYWVDEPEPDLAYHITRRALVGGDWQALQCLLAELHQRAMDLSRPLWEMCLVQGLRQVPGLPLECQVLVLKMHHAAIDGMSLAAIIDAMHRRARRPAERRVAVERKPDYWDIWTRLNLNNLSRQWRFAGTVRRLLPAVVRAHRVRRGSELPPVLTGRARFNDRVGGGRAVGAVFWPREVFLAIRRAVRQVTLNDIALAVVSGALREYLARHGELPARSLVAGVPVNLRRAGASDGGNRIATMMVGLATTSRDPVERLRLVHRYAVEGKRHIDALGTGTVMDISDSVSPNILAGGIRTLARAGVLALTPVPFHTMVSSVPGPLQPLRLGAAELVLPLGFGPVRDNMGLFHIVSGSHAWVSLSFSACDRLLPDAAFYRECLQRSGAALLAQAVGDDQPVA